MKRFYPLFLMILLSCEKDHFTISNNDIEFRSELAYPDFHSEYPDSTVIDGVTIPFQYTGEIVTFRNTGIMSDSMYIELKVKGNRNDAIFIYVIEHGTVMQYEIPFGSIPVGQTSKLMRFGIVYENESPMYITVSDIHEVFIPGQVDQPVIEKQMLTKRQRRSKTI